MKFKFGAALAVAGSFAIVRCLAGINSTPVVVLAQDDPSKPAYFSEKVKPILEANCYRCHGGSNHRGGYNMNTRKLMLKGGRNGAAIVNGQPESSLLVKLVHYEGPGGALYADAAASQTKTLGSRYSCPGELDQGRGSHAS